MLVNKKEIDCKALIRKAFKQITSENIRKAIERSLRLIEAET